MAATGEECYHQKPIHDYFDSGYDKIFDAHIEHYCARFEKNVVPARQCGTVCQGFEPLVGLPRTEQSRTDEGAVQAAYIRKYLQQQLYGVCDKLRDKARAMEQKSQSQEQRLRDIDRWLGRAETQPDTLDREIVEAEQEIAAIKEMQASIQWELRAEKTGHGGARDFEQLWLEMDTWAIKRKHARERKERAEEIRVKRGQVEREQGNLLSRPEALVDRITLLKQLHTAVMRHVKARLADTDKPLTDVEIDGIQRLLQEVSRYTADDVPLAVLKAKVEELSERDSAL